MKDQLDWTDKFIVATLEVAPPGYEPVVRALKKKGNVDNPFATAWAMKGKEGKKVKKEKEVSGDGPGRGQFPEDQGTQDDVETELDKRAKRYGKVTADKKGKGSKKVPAPVEL